MKLAKKVLEHGPVEAALIPKIIVQHGLIRMGGSGDFLRAGSSHSLGGKVLLGGGQDTARRGGVLSFPASSWHV
jgi:hypothetical protein